MKWLMIILLISCGHQEPEQMDLEDSDGDSVANAYEAEQGKFHAEFRALNKIEGVMSLADEKNMTNFEIAFTTFRDLNHEAYHLLTWREDKLPFHDFFTEFSRLIFKTRLPDNSLVPDKVYNVKLKFESSEDQAEFIYLVDKKSRIKLARLEKNDNIRISGKNILAILNEEAHLDLTRAENDSEKLAKIKAKNYRIYHHDGNETKIFYYSKSFSFGSYLEKHNLTNARSLEAGGITEMNDDQEGWWYRELANGDKVLVFSQIAKIKESYLEGLQKGFNTLSRVEGKSQNLITLKKENDQDVQRVLLKISPGIQRNRTFYDRRYVSRQEDSRTRTCESIRRNISGETNLETDQQALMANLLINVDNNGISLSQVLRDVQTKFDDKGKMYWELKLEFSGLELGINVRDLPGPDTIWGNIYTNCRQYREKIIPVHTEISYSMAAKAYLED